MKEKREDRSTRKQLDDFRYLLDIHENARCEMFHIVYRNAEHFTYTFAKILLFDLHILIQNIF